PWTPSKQTERLSGFGGARAQYGPVTADASLRLATTRNRQGGSPLQPQTAFRESGWWSPSYDAGLFAPTTQTLNAQTLGLSLGVAPVSWWSHELVIGHDRATTESPRDAPRFFSPVGGDTALVLSQTMSSR